MKILDRIGNSMLVEQELPDKTIYEIYVDFKRLNFFKNRDVAISEWASVAGNL